MMPLKIFQVIKNNFWKYKNIDISTFLSLEKLKVQYFHVSVYYSCAMYVHLKKAHK